eukprot:scaffold82066_cov20-Prasinocladus_malaysianus.AAC.2
MALMRCVFKSHAALSTCHAQPGVPKVVKSTPACVHAAADTGAVVAVCMVLCKMMTDSNRQLLCDYVITGGHRETSPQQIHRAVETCASSQSAARHCSHSPSLYTSFSAMIGACLQSLTLRNFMNADKWNSGTNNV